LSIRVLVASLVVAAPAVLLAHHSTPLYDMTKPVTVEGPLTDVKFRFPHVTANVKWQNKIWKVTFPPPTVVAGWGVTREMLASKAVTIVGHVRKDGKAEIRVGRVTVNGKTF
jgi:hypothetical protein